MPTAVSPGSRACEGYGACGLFGEGGTQGREGEELSKGMGPGKAQPQTEVQGTQGHKSHPSCPRLEERGLACTLESAIGCEPSTPNKTERKKRSCTAWPSSAETFLCRSSCKLLAANAVAPKESVQQLWEAGQGGAPW